MIFITESILKELYDFRMVHIDISENNYKEAMALRQKHPPFQNIGVAKFISSVILWRCLDEKEFNNIRKTGKITGGNYSIPVEREFGASFSGSRQDVIDWGIKVKRNGRFVGQLYIIGIIGEDKEFLNLNMEERLEEQGKSYRVGSFYINTKLGNTGLGFSVRDVSFSTSDVLSVYSLDDKTGQLTDLTHDIF